MELALGKNLAVDSEELTAWIWEISEIRRVVDQPLKQGVVVAEDGSLTLVAGNDEVQLALRVAPGHWHATSAH